MVGVLTKVNKFSGLVIWAINCLANGHSITYRFRRLQVITCIFQSWAHTITLVYLVTPRYNESSLKRTIIKFREKVVSGILQCVAQVDNN